MTLSVDAYVGPYKVEASIVDDAGTVAGGDVIAVVEAADLVATVPAGDDWDMSFHVDGFGFTKPTVVEVSMTVNAPSLSTGAHRQSVG